MHTIDPDRWPIRVGNANLQSKSGPRTFTARQRSSRSTSRSTAGDSQSTPALFTTHRGRPKWSNVCSIRRRMSSTCVTSHRIPMAVPPPLYHLCRCEWSPRQISRTWCPQRYLLQFEPRPQPGSLGRQAKTDRAADAAAAPVTSYALSCNVMMTPPRAARWVALHSATCGPTRVEDVHTIPSLLYGGDDSDFL